MLDSLTHPLKFPKYSTVAQYEGDGHYAILNYYRWPYRFFYRHKIRMIERVLRGRRYKSAIDFGSGPGILSNQWLKFTDVLHMVDKNYVMPKGKVELIICSSVMEFVELDETFKMLADSLEPGGDIIIASPMDTDLTKLYFGYIGDRNQRHSHQEITAEMSKWFNIRQYKTWMGLYFCAMGKKR